MILPLIKSRGNQKQHRETSITRRAGNEWRLCVALYCTVVVGVSLLYLPTVRMDTLVNTKSTVLPFTLLTP